MSYPRLGLGGCRILALALVLTTAVAACRPDTEEEADLEPTPTPVPHGTRCPPSYCVLYADEVLAFDPNTVPLSQRAAAGSNRSLVASFEKPRLFAATDQAGNYVDPKVPKNDYTSGFQGGGDGGNVYNFSQWPYVGLFYYYVHATVSVPPTGYINTAHRHGTPILGVTTGDCRDEPCAEELSKLFETPVQTVDKLALIANTFGFDGWLIDVEGVGLGPAVEVMKGLRARTGPSGKPLIVLYYKAFVNDLSQPADQEAFNAAGFFQSDYWDGEPSKTYDFVIKNAAPNNNPFTTSWAGDMYRGYAHDGQCQPPQNSADQIDNGSACLDTKGLFGERVAKIVNPKGGFYQSPALFALGWERWGGPDINRNTPRAQIQAAHRDLFVGYGVVHAGPSCQPTPRAAHAVGAFVEPAGVVLTAPFVTRFNTGEGDFFRVQGGVGAQTAWNGIGLQDVQPTWLCTQGNGQSVKITYDDSYDGGSALAVTGTGIVSLYKTDMAPPATPLAIVRYKGPRSNPPKLVVKDETGAWLIASERTHSVVGQWETSAQQLTRPVRGNIREIGILADSPVTIGELALVNNQSYPVPSTQTLPPPTSGDLEWTNSSDTWYANVYGCTGSGAPPQLLGRSFQPAFDIRYTILKTPPSAPFSSYVVQPVSKVGAAALTVSCS